MVQGGPLVPLLAFLRTMPVLRLQRSDGSVLAIEVVMLRHEAAVLRRQVALRWVNTALSGPTASASD